MNTLLAMTENYLNYCKTQKRLANKTLKAYHTDLNQFASFFNNYTTDSISITDIEKYIGYLHENFKPKTAKRKLASIKVFFHFLNIRIILIKILLIKLKPVSVNQYYYLKQFLFT